MDQFLYFSSQRFKIVYMVLVYLPKCIIFIFEFSVIHVVDSKVNKVLKASESEQTKGILVRNNTFRK